MEILHLRLQCSSGESPASSSMTLMKRIFHLKSCIFLDSCHYKKIRHHFNQQTSFENLKSSSSTVILKSLAFSSSTIIITKASNIPISSHHWKELKSSSLKSCSLRYLQSSWLILVSLLSTIIMMESLLFVMYRHHDKVWCGPDLQSLSSSSTVIITWWRVIHRNSERT